MISVIIPSYRNPAYLDLCLQSAIEGQDSGTNEIIVMLDGYGDESLSVLEKYKKRNVYVVNLEQNMGQTYVHNTGVALAHHKNILIVNDDNVFPRNWDMKLGRYASELDTHVFSPNQIEPNPSIFQSFVIKDFGKTAIDFRMNEFLDYESRLTSSLGDKTNDGQTWPLFIKKKHYMALNGIDAGFPNPAVADWDFFMRCELMGLSCSRLLNVHFYHFAGAATKRSPEQAAKQAQGEAESMQYFEWKWGKKPFRNTRNSTLVQNYRGI